MHRKMFNRGQGTIGLNQPLRPNARTTGGAHDGTERSGARNSSKPTVNAAIAPFCRRPGMWPVIWGMPLPGFSWRRARRAWSAAPTTTISAVAIPRGFRRYRKIGGKRFEISQVEITELDDVNVMARVHWDFAYERPEGRRQRHDPVSEPVFPEFRRRSAEAGFACIAPDEEKAMKEHDLIGFGGA